MLTKIMTPPQQTKVKYLPEVINMSKLRASCTSHWSHKLTALMVERLRCGDDLWPCFTPQKLNHFSKTNKQGKIKPHQSGHCCVGSQTWISTSWGKVYCLQISSSFITAGRKKCKQCDPKHHVLISYHTVTRAFFTKQRHSRTFTAIIIM